MVATLLSCGARPNLVTDPTPQYPGGCTAADLAYMKGCDGLAAFLSEKSLVEQFNEMSLAGNISGSLETSSTDPVNAENLTEDQLYVKETLAAYRISAEAAARIQAAFREHSFKLRYKAVEIISPEEEARQIVAAMRIQHAFRNYESKKKMTAVARIQHRFRTWKYRREFLNMRHQAIKIQVRPTHPLFLLTILSKYVTMKNDVICSRQFLDGLTVDSCQLAHIMCPVPQVMRTFMLIQALLVTTYLNLTSQLFVC